MLQVGQAHCCLSHSKDPVRPLDVALEVLRRSDAAVTPVNELVDMID